ncbi:uncharacterized protein EAF01_011959 [Botrytis porri]|uniref:uncharacterized protein n=1 Tax=Botrytis porri TaxID=87229 RepID=UPI001901B793|nr:uncharacterized protein EAF01_011959 [Botrytis porri]KAF7880690.1 hypothetical protein EAF01_011959 [Botrytis porri]
MGKGKKMAGNANMEPLGSRTKIPTYNSNPLKQEENDEDLPNFRAEASSYMFGSIKQEEDNEDSFRGRFRSRSPLETHQSPRRTRSQCRSRSPDDHHRSISKTRRYSNHYRPRYRSPKSSRISQNPHKSRQSQRSISSISAQKVSSSSSYRFRSPDHRDQDTPSGFYYGQNPRRSSPTDKGASRGSYYTPSSRRDSPKDRGVQNSSYYRPSYSVRNTSMFPESKSRALSLASTYSLRESLDDEETLTTESWTKLASRKHGEFMFPAYNSPEPPSPIEESWAEIASRKHKELMAIKAADTTTSKDIPLATSVGESKPLKQTITLEQSTSVAKDTPVSPVKDVRSLLFERRRQSKAQGLDIQNQISSLLYPRKRKARQIPPTETKIDVTTDMEKDVGFAKLSESSAQHSNTSPLPIPLQEMSSQSEALVSASDQGIHLERQGFLNDLPMLISSSQRSSLSPEKSTFVTVQDIYPQSEFNVSALNQGMHPERQFLLQTSPSPNESPEHLHQQAESRLTISPPIIKIETQTLQSKIQLRRASSPDEKPKPIPSIMSEPSFTDDLFQSDQYQDVEPVIPTHWQD